MRRAGGKCVALNSHIVSCRYVESNMTDGHGFSDQQNQIVLEEVSSQIYEGVYAVLFDRYCTEYKEKDQQLLSTFKDLRGAFLVWPSGAV